jgi:hypothetical protein
MISEVVLFIMPDGQWQSLTDVPSSQHRNDRQAIHKSQCLQGDLLPGGSQVSLPGRFIKTLPPPPDVKLVPLISV